MRSYNLFRLKSEEGLCCAVPQTRAVPSFVTGGRWTFGGTIEERSTAPFGFDGKAAATSVRFNGFYLFQALDSPVPDGLREAESPTVSRKSASFL